VTLIKSVKSSITADPAVSETRMENDNFYKYKVYKKNMSNLQKHHIKIWKCTWSAQITLKFVQHDPALDAQCFSTLESVAS